jgi:hypothetical protein
MATAFKALLDLSDELEEAIGLADADHVDLDVDHDRSGFIWIGRIDRRAEGVSGAGRRAIERVLEIADEQGVEVRLACIEGGLVEYYESLGFSIDPLAQCRDDDFVIMAREPS